MHEHFYKCHDITFHLSCTDDRPHRLFLLTFATKPIIQLLMPCTVTETLRTKVIIFASIIRCDSFVSFQSFHVKRNKLEIVVCEAKRKRFIWLTFKNVPFFSAVYYEFHTFCLLCDAVIKQRERSEIVSDIVDYETSDK